MWATGPGWASGQYTQPRHRLGLDLEDECTSSDTEGREYGGYTLSLQGKWEVERVHACGFHFLWQSEVRQSAKKMRRVRIYRWWGRVRIIMSGNRDIGTLGDVQTFLVLENMISKWHSSASLWNVLHLSSRWRENRVCKDYTFLKKGRSEDECEGSG